MAQPTIVIGTCQRHHHEGAFLTLEGIDVVHLDTALCQLGTEERFLRIVHSNDTNLSRSCTTIEQCKYTFDNGVGFQLVARRCTSTSSMLFWTGRVSDMAEEERVSVIGPRKCDVCSINLNLRPICDLAFVEFLRHKS